MAISPKSKGLGNIGNIVNRQGMASPTRPQAKPAPKPMAKMPVPKPVSQANPFVGGKTTTMAQRQAMSPFKSATKPMAKVNPMAGQPAMPMIPPQFMPPMRPDVEPPQPFNPNPNPGQIGQPGLPYFPFGGDFNPGQMPLDQLIRPEVGRNQADVQREVEAMMNQQGGGIFGGNLPGMVGNAVGQGLSGLFGNLGSAADFGGQQALQQGIQGGLGQLFGNMFGNQPSTMESPRGPDGRYLNENMVPQPGFDFNGNVSMPNPNDFPGVMPNNQIGPSFNVGGATMGRFADYGNPNPMSSDYDQLEGSSFNTNPSMGGSLFGSGGFANK